MKALNPINVYSFERKVCPRIEYIQGPGNLRVSVKKSHDRCPRTSFTDDNIHAVRKVIECDSLLTAEEIVTEVEIN